MRAGITHVGHDMLLIEFVRGHHGADLLELPPFGHNPAPWLPSHTATSTAPERIGKDSGDEPLVSRSSTYTGPHCR